MIPQQAAFNKQINELLCENPQSSASKLIRSIMESSKIDGDFYTVFDDLSGRVGIGYLAHPVLDKNYKVVGYKPRLKYYPNNLLEIEPYTEELISNYLTFSRCYAYLAKEFVYRLMKIDTPLIVQKLQMQKQ